MEVTYHGTVTTPPRFFSSHHNRREHEQFDARADDGSMFRVIDNTTITGRIPVNTGDRVDVRGELVHDRGRPPIVHWTHHDPGGRHPDGFVRAGDRVYA